LWININKKWKSNGQRELSMKQASSVSACNETNEAVYLPEEQVLKPVVDEQMAVSVLVVVVTTIEVLVEVPLVQSKAFVSVKCY